MFTCPFVEAPGAHGIQTAVLTIYSSVVCRNPLRNGAQEILPLPLITCKHPGPHGSVYTTSAHTPFASN